MKKRNGKAKSKKEKAKRKKRKDKSPIRGKEGGDKKSAMGGSPACDLKLET